MLLEVGVTFAEAGDDDAMIVIKRETEQYSRTEEKAGENSGKQEGRGEGREE